MGTLLLLIAIIIVILVAAFLPGWGRKRKSKRLDKKQGRIDEKDKE